jgi:hypothetical protein
MLQTPVINLECNPILSFWYCAEASNHPMDLEVYCNGFLVFPHYGYTHTSYIQAIVPLAAFENTPVVIEFFGLTSDFYGQMLEDVMVEDEPCDGDGGDEIWFNMTYQVDLYDPAMVILEIAPVNLGDPEDYTLVTYDSYGDGWIPSGPCDGCEAVIDVFVNGVPVIEDFFCPDSYEEATFQAEPGEDIVVCYHGVDFVDTCGECIWEWEHAWRLLAPGGEVLLEDGFDKNGDNTEEPADQCWNVGACTDCPTTKCMCPPGINAWTQVDMFTGNAPGICQHYAAVLPIPEGTDLLCLRLRLDTTHPMFAGWDYAGPGIGMHIHELCISDIVFDPITGEIGDFCDDFEDGELPTPTAPANGECGLGCDCDEDHDFMWVVDCVDYDENWTKVGPHCFRLSHFGFSNLDAQECGEGVLMIYDTYGDGWDSEGDGYMDGHCDMYINGVQILDDFTVTPDDVTPTGFNGKWIPIPMTLGDTYQICLSSSGGPWTNEHCWVLFGPDGWLIPGATGCDDGCGSGTITSFFGGPWQIANGEPIHCALIWDTEIEDAYYAEFYGTLSYYIPAGCTMYLELSADGGDNWFIIEKITGIDAITMAFNELVRFDLTPWAGQSILIRVRVHNYGIDANHDGIIDQWNDGWVEVCNFYIVGKQDTEPPVTTLQMTGTMTDSGWYSTPVQCTITATDDTGMGEIHYILDGVHTVKEGYSVTFTVSEDGAHNLEFWGVDAMGNEEAHHVVPTFRIDSGNPPTVEITAPEPGLYLFGNKLLSASKVFIIGAFEIEATASDLESGVYRVQFYLDGDLISESTEVPYSAYCAQKHMGAGTIKAVAEDFSGNTAEDTLDITYYKFL